MSNKPENDAKLARWKRWQTHLNLAERAANFGYWRAQLSNNAYYWSPGMYRMLDVPLSQKPDVEWLYQQMRPGDREIVEAALAKAIRTRSPFSYRTYGQFPHDQIVDTQGEVEIGEDGRVIALLGVCHDVTAKVRAEEAREKAQQMYRVMTEGASDIIIFYAPNRDILFASQALERILGRTIGEIEHGKFLDLVHPDDAEYAVGLKLVTAPDQTNSFDYRLRHGDGHYIWLETTTRAIYDKQTNALLNMISVSRDITARKEQDLQIKAARERAENANRAKSRFLANMSHELRTPLNAIIGFTDLMRRNVFGPIGNARYEEYATLIYDSGQLLLDHITDMLDMAKIEAGKLELNFERVDLTGTIDDCVRMLAERAQNGGVGLGVHPANGPTSLHANRRAVKQILLNLISNAVKFTPAGGQVTVSTRVENDRVVVFVRDEGIGIPSEDLPRLGQPFEQVCADPMLAKSGTGLGLALVRSLVETHGGTLRIASEEGRGTEVSVDFAQSEKRQAVA